MATNKMHYNAILKAQREALIPKQSMSSQLFRAQREGLDIDFVSGRDDGEGPTERRYEYEKSNYDELENLEFCYNNGIY